MTTHTTQPDVLKRLKRAYGHLNSIIQMMEGGRDCMDIAQQLLAVESAIAKAKKQLVHDHIDHCLERAVSDGQHSAQETIREFKEITKYL